MTWLQELPEVENPPLRVNASSTADVLDLEIPDGLLERGEAAHAEWAR